MDTSNKIEEAAPAASTPAPVISEVTISSVGDCTIGSDSKFSYNGSFMQVFQNNNKDYSYFFKNVSDIFKKDDLTTANLETTFTNADVKAEKEFTFKAPPDYAKVLTDASIEGVNIANNHIRDYLTKGLSDTKQSLKAVGINYFGEGEKWIAEVKGIKFGFLGYTGFYYDDNFLNNLKKDIQDLKNEGCLVIINFHWGVEGSNYPNNTQKYLAHYSIDNGADLIIGHHPHVIQGMEFYKDKPIAYSLGNFCFGGNKNPSDKDTFILQSNFKFENKKLISYGIRVIPCSISSVSYKNDYCPILLTENKKDAFLKRINSYSFNLNFKLSDNFHDIAVNN
ncbi:CapA family protein [Candidatus Clostridium stratigraminis]